MLFPPANEIGINIWAFQAAKMFVSPAMNVFMHYLAESFLIVIPVLVLYMLLKKDMNVYSFVVAGIVFYVVSDVIKMIVAEPRPCHDLNITSILTPPYGCESSFSFPSNHASVLTGLTVFMGKYKYVRVLYIVWLLLVLFGRVYLVLHFLTDIIAGAAVSLVLAYIIYRYRDYINKRLNRIVKRILPILAVEK